jgi:hypothetical protein
MLQMGTRFMINDLHRSGVTIGGVWPIAGHGRAAMGRIGIGSRTGYTLRGARNEIRNSYPVRPSCFSPLRVI